MRRDVVPRAGQSQSSDGYRTLAGSVAKMQGLSSRAHAFSVEALVGKPCKRMKVSEEHESSSAGDTSGDTSIFTGEEAERRTAGCMCVPSRHYFNVHAHFTHELEEKKSNCFCSVRLVFLPFTPFNNFTIQLLLMFDHNKTNIIK